MIRKIRSKASAVALAVALATTNSLFFAAPAHAAVSGTVLCNTYTSQYSVVGVWINSSNDTHDGWASWSRVPGQPWKATYSKSNVASGESYKVHVGCGGTTSNWNQTAYSLWVTGNHDFICHVSSSPAHRVCSS